MDSQLKIIVTDDFAPMRQTVKRSLESMGYENIYTCQNGREAWEILENKHIDLVLSDINMPVMSGQTLLEKVRNSKKLSHIPFIMLTAEGERDMVMAAINAGVSEFVVKPFTPNLLEKKIYRALHSKKPMLSLEKGTGMPLIEKSLDKSTNEEPVIATNDTILVVDDSPSNIDVIVNLLNKKYKVKAATNGKKAISLATSDSPPSLILLDIMMPEMDGYSVCKILKEDPRCMDIPIIFLSAKGEVKDITKGLELGAVDYVTKPIEPEILLARISTHLAIRKSKNDLSNQLDHMIEMARMQEDIDRIMRHDLKNPLSAITAHTTILMDDPNYSEKQKADINSIQQAANQALNMVTSSLDLFKMETGKYQFKPKSIDIVTILKSVIQDLEGLEKSHRVKFEFSIYHKHVFVLGEETLCYSTLCNLIKNAIEASPDQGKIKLTVEEVGHDIAIRIYNQGVIDPSIRSKLFDKYVTANKEGGTGLGTYSAMMMTLMQKGKLEFETINNEGTLFSLILANSGSGPNKIKK